MTHPNSLDLEAFACGDSVAGIAEHVGACPDCQAFVERARSIANKGTEDARRAVERARRTTGRRFFIAAAAVAVPLAAAAALLLVVRAPTEGSDSGITFKGGAQLAVIRERDGEQTRFTSPLRVQPGDHLRLEVALDREQTVVGAVLGDDDSYVELMPGKARGAGTHLSELSARVDATPLDATIVVGSENAVTRARRLHRFDDVTAIRVQWEAPK